MVFVNYFHHTFSLAEVVMICISNWQVPDNVKIKPNSNPSKDLFTLLFQKVWKYLTY
jgi:hypothetical protein